MIVPIDWDFIAAREGGRQLEGYVPMPDTSRSGVTIATGCDIGQRRVADIDALDIPAGLKERLKPYCGLRRQAAVTALAARPLTITASEAAALDQAVKTGESAALRAAYDAATDRTGPRFAQLPGAVQTAIASVAFQYGTNLAVRTPRFWAAVTAQDWAAAVSELRDFGDDYASRRNLEADLLDDYLAAPGDS